MLGSKGIKSLQDFSPNQAADALRYAFERIAGTIAAAGQPSWRLAFDGTKTTAKSGSGRSGECRENSQQWRRSRSEGATPHAITNS